LLFHEEKEEEVVVGVVVGMEDLVSLADVGIFLFLGLGVGADGIFCVSCGCGDASFFVFSG
jgi:hypothetical protein